MLRRAEVREHPGLRRGPGLGCYEVHPWLRWDRPAHGLPHRPNQLECVVQLCGRDSGGEVRNGQGWDVGWLWRVQLSAMAFPAAAATAATEAATAAIAA